MLSLADKGFKQISVEPVVAPASEPYAIQEEDLPELCEQYDLLAKEIVKRDRAGKHFNFFHFMIDLEGVHALPNVYQDAVQVQNILL